MILYIFHQGRTATVEYPNLDGMLRYRQDSKSFDDRIRYTVHMDKGFIAWTHGRYLVTDLWMDTNQFISNAIFHRPTSGLKCVAGNRVKLTGDPQLFIDITIKFFYRS